MRERPFPYQSRYYFIPISIDRYLCAKGKKYLCDNLSASDFTKLLSVIQRRQRLMERAHSVAVERQAGISPDSMRPDYQRRFLIPRDELLAAERQRISQIVLGLLLVSAAMYAAWYFFVYTGVEPSPTAVAVEGLPIWTAFFIGLIFVVVPLIVFLNRQSGYSRALPAEFRLSSGTLWVDERPFPVREIEKITMTPADYSHSRGSLTKRLLRIRYEGGTETYQLGTTLPGKRQYKEYTALCEALENLCLDANIPFAYDLL